MKELMKETKTYRVDTENEAIQMIEDYREKAHTEPYEVNKAGYAKKTKKQKGVIIDEYFIVDVSFLYE